MSNRIEQPGREQISADERGAYDAVVERLARMGLPPGQAGPYHGALLQSPPLAHAISELGRLVRAGQERGTYTDAERELVDVVLSRDVGYYAVLGVHIPAALAAGVRIEAIDAVWSDRLSELTDGERQLVTYVRAVAAGEVTPELWDAIVQRLGERGAVEYTVFITFLQMTLSLMSALGVPSPARGEVGRLIADYRDGRQPVGAGS